MADIWVQMDRENIADDMEVVIGAEKDAPTKNKAASLAWLVKRGRTLDQKETANWNIENAWNTWDKHFARWWEDSIEYVATSSGKPGEYQERSPSNFPSAVAIEYFDDENWYPPRHSDTFRKIYGGLQDKGNQWNPKDLSNVSEWNTGGRTPLREYVKNMRNYNAKTAKRRRKLM